MFPSAAVDGERGRHRGQLYPAGSTRVPCTYSKKARFLSRGAVSRGMFCSVCLRPGAGACPVVIMQQKPGLRNNCEDTSMTIPNMITLARMALVPGFLVCIIYDHLQISLAIFILAALTDALDGYLARRLQQESQLGLYLDPLADKLLCAVSYLSLALIGLVPAWLAVVVLFKDLFIGMGITIIFLAGQTPQAAPTRWGKGTTFLQAVAIGMAMLWAVLGRETTGLGVLFWLTGVLTVLSGSHYILQGFRQIEEGKKVSGYL